MSDNVPSDDGQAEESIVALFARLIDDAERFVRAELKLYRATLFARLLEARSAIIMLLASLFLALAAIIALLVGLIFILRQPLGAIGATVAVFGGSMAIAGLLAWVAIIKIRQATDIKDKPR